MEYSVSDGVRFSSRSFLRRYFLYEKIGGKMVRRSGSIRDLFKLGIIFLARFFCWCWLFFSRQRGMLEQKIVQRQCAPDCFKLVYRFATLLLRAMEFDKITTRALRGLWRFRLSLFKVDTSMVNAVSSSDGKNIYLVVIFAKLRICHC